MQQPDWRDYFAQRVRRLRAQYPDFGRNPHEYDYPVAKAMIEAVRDEQWARLAGDGKAFRAWRNAQQPHEIGAILNDPEKRHYIETAIGGPLVRVDATA